MAEKSVPRYKLENQIFEGVTSLIYRAEDRQLERTVALKRLREELIQEKPQYNAVLAREAKLLSKLEHPHILPIYDFGTWEESPFLVSRFIPGGDFGRVMRQGKSLPSDQIILIARQIGLALDFCQGRGFAHRNIMPDNILMDDSTHTYLADFGLACEFASNEYQQGVGDHRFIAPEQLPNTPFYGCGQSCDQFSLGVTLYFLLTGRLPLPPDAESKYKSLRPTIRDQMLQCTAFHIACGEQIPPIPDQYNVPSGVNAVFRRMLALAPEDRFPTSSEAAEHLQQSLRGVINQPVHGTIFVSYSSADKDYVKNLIRTMEQCRLNIWWDRHIQTGSTWYQEIEKSLKSCDVMLVVLTGNSVESTEVRREYSYWLDLKKPLVTLVFPNCLPPYRLYDLQHVFAEGKSLEVLAEELAEAFRRFQPEPEAPVTRIPEVPSSEESDPDEDEGDRQPDDFPQGFKPRKRERDTGKDPIWRGLEKRRPTSFRFAQLQTSLELTDAAPAQILNVLGRDALYMPGSDIFEKEKGGLFKYIEAGGRIIGIDLGATTCVVAIPEARSGAGFMTLPDCEGASIVRDRFKRLLTPSVVTEDSRGEIVVGHPAKGRAGFSPEPIAFAQQWVGEEKSFLFAKQGGLRLADVSVHLMRYLRVMAEEQLDQPINKAVITIPAHIAASAKAMIEKSAMTAGLRVVQFAFNPVAAALVHFRNDPRDRLRIMAYDLGGGTFEATILEKRNGVISANSILAFDGDQFLGGDNFDRKLSVWLLEQLKAQGYELSPELDDPGNRLIFAKLMVYAERAKIALSARESYEIEDPETGITDRAGNPIAIYLDLTRAQFEGLINEEIERTIHLARQALEKVKQAVSERSRAEEERFELDEIVLVGGSSRIPCIAQRLEKEFGLVPRSIAPDLCVALGAALIARDRPKAGEQR